MFENNRNFHVSRIAHRDGGLLRIIEIPIDLAPPLPTVHQQKNELDLEEIIVDLCSCQYPRAFALPEVDAAEFNKLKIAVVNDIINFSGLLVGPYRIITLI